VSPCPIGIDAPAVVDAFDENLGLAFNGPLCMCASVCVCRCSALLISGQHSIFNTSTRSLHQAITKTCADKTKVEFIEVIGVANVVEEKVDAQSYF